MPNSVEPTVMAVDWPEQSMPAAAPTASPAFGIEHPAGTMAVAGI
jgi:hypothetical protein